MGNSRALQSEGLQAAIATGTGEQIILIQKDVHINEKKSGGWRGEGGGWRVLQQQKKLF